MKKETILIVDDEEDILELIRYNLEQEGYHIFCAETGESGLKIAKTKLPDIIILDLMLPGINGLDVARILKNTKETRDIPIIMLTAKNEEVDMILGLEMGADDYITKPFSPRVLLARIRAVSRRRASQVSDDHPQRIDFGSLSIDIGKRAVFVENNPVELTYTEFQLLNFLIRKPGWVFSRSQIVDGVKGDNYPVTDRSVDVQIAGLRKKLGSCGKYIETVRGVGYRFRETL